MYINISKNKKNWYCRHTYEQGSKPTVTQKKLIIHKIGQIKRLIKHSILMISRISSRSLECLLLKIPNTLQIKKFLEYVKQRSILSQFFQQYFIQCFLTLNFQLFTLFSGLLKKKPAGEFCFKNLEIPFKLPSTSSDMTKIFKTNVLQIVILFCRPLLNQPETFCFCRCLTLYSSDAAH